MRHFESDLIEIYGFDEKLPFSRVREQLLAEVAGTRSGGHHIHDTFPGRRTFRDVFEGHMPVGDDPDQEVVEVMRDAPCQHAEAFQLLRVLASLLGLSPIRFRVQTLKLRAGPRRKDAQNRHTEKVVVHGPVVHDHQMS